MKLNRIYFFHQPSTVRTLFDEEETDEEFIQRSWLLFPISVNDEFVLAKVFHCGSGQFREDGKYPLHIFENGLATEVIQAMLDELNAGIKNVEINFNLFDEVDT